MRDIRDSQMVRRPGALVLASTSQARRALLEQAGVPVEVVRPDVDEAAIKEALAQDMPDLDGDDLAEMLARTKAEAVMGRAAGRLIIAGDQVLTCEGEHFDKPKTLAEAQAQLLALRGKTHSLHTAVVIADPDAQSWVHVETVDVTFRQFSPEFVGRYLSDVGEQALTSVGGYQLEGRGVHMIERIRGDYFAVLGLPLLALLAELRARDIVAV